MLYCFMYTKTVAYSFSIEFSYSRPMSISIIHSLCHCVNSVIQETLLIHHPDAGELRFGYLSVAPQKPVRHLPVLADDRLSSTPARHSVLLQQLFETCRSHYWALHPTVSLGSLRLLSVVDHRRVLLRTPTNVASFKSFELSINAIDELGLLPNVCSLGTAVTFVPLLADFKLFFQRDGYHSAHHYTIAMCSFCRGIKLSPTDCFTLSLPCDRY